MADAHERALERRAHDGGPEDAARLLRERLRAGRVSERGLELAAALGDPAAALATGVEPDAHEPDLREWLWGLLRWGPETVVRALVGACRGALDLAPEDVERGPLEDVLEELEGWCDSVEQRGFEEALRRSGDLEFAGIAGERGWSFVLGTSAHSLVMAAWIAGQGVEKPFRYKAWEVLRSLSDALSEEELRTFMTDHLMEFAFREPAPEDRADD